MPYLAPLSNRLGKLFFLLLFLSLGLISAGPAGAEDIFGGYWTTEEAEEREREARKVLAEDPNSLPALELLARSLLEQRKSIEAIQILERAYRIGPNQTRAVYLARYSDWVKEQATWALKALSYPQVSFHALELFESALRSKPELTTLVNNDVRRARAHKAKWDALVESIDRRLPTIRLSYSSTEYERRLRRWPSADLDAKVENGKLIARSSSGEIKWSVPWRDGPVKTVSQKERLFVIQPERVLLLDPKTGKTLHTWPGELSFKVGGYTPKWKAWDAPDAIFGADSSRVYMVFDHWLFVLRQEDAGGWAYYFSYDIRAKRSADGEILVIEDHYNTIHTFRIRDGKKLWKYRHGKQLDVQLLDVRESEIVIYLYQIGRLVTLSRDKGEVLRQRSHLQL